MHSTILFTLVVLLCCIKMLISIGRKTSADFGRSSLSTRLFSSRHSSAGLSLDVNLVACDNELIISHLTARKSNHDLLEAVRKIPELRSKRNALIVEGDAARNSRKKLSTLIGSLMKERKIDEVERVKVQVEDFSKQSFNADQKQIEIENEIDKIMSIIPNLLDDRCGALIYRNSIINWSLFTIFIFYFS